MRKKITKTLRVLSTSVIALIAIMVLLSAAACDQSNKPFDPLGSSEMETMLSTEPAIPTEKITIKPTDPSTTATSTSRTTNEYMTTKITTSKATTTATQATTTSKESSNTTVKQTTTITKKPSTTTTKQTTTTSKEPSTTTKKQTTTTTTSNPPTQQGRPINHKNMVDMINEERARIGNSVRVSYGDATLQKIATIRTKEQERLFGHTRPMPCPGCDYCHGEKDCIATEAIWIMETYGQKYSAGGYAGRGIPTTWTVEEFLAFVKTSPGHYNQMFKANWTKFAYDTYPYTMNTIYIYFNYGR